MVTQVEKRDGRIVPYEREKIENAVHKAFKAAREGFWRETKEVVSEVEDRLNETGKKTVAVEEIQDIVERSLMKLHYFATAKAYIVYRAQRGKARNVTATMLDIEGTVARYLDGASWRVKENSNMNYSLQGLNNHIIGAVSARYWLQHIYPPEIQEAHISGDIHIHDLGLLAPYCNGWDLADLLQEGFRGAPEKTESAPARHFRTALGQITNFCYSMQGEAAGAQALASFDTYLAPFVRYDGLTYREVKQAMQEFIFNLNVPTRVGFQTPFVNLTFDVSVPTHMKDEPVIFGGKRMFYDAPYGDYQAEMDMINTAFCNIMTEGDAKGRIFTFPIPTYNITKDFPWGSPIAQNIMAMTAKYGIPYFANFMNSDMKPEDVRSMCCRLRLDIRKLQRRGGGLFGANPLTGSIGVVTINLPRIGYLAKSEEDFFKRLRKQMDLAKTSLVLKRKTLEHFTEQGLYPYSAFYLRGVKQIHDSYWENHFNTIGIVGMHEALRNFHHDSGSIMTPAGHAFALRMLDFMRQQLQDYQEETGRLFNLEATPAEGTCYRLARLDKERYPDIITSGNNEPYYTNSTQLPVNHGLDLFTALDHQDQLQTKYTGGTVFHAFLGERIADLATCEQAIRTVFKHYRLPYFSLTPTFSVCQEHGYLTGEQPRCPHCGQETEVWSRVVGYYRPVKNWNKGKQEEFNQRSTFGIQQKQSKAAI